MTERIEHCRFCLENTCIESCYNNHSLRNCPVLKPHRCTKCGDFAHTVKYHGRTRHSFVTDNYDDPRLPIPMMGHILNQKRNRALEKLTPPDTSERTVPERENEQPPYLPEDSEKEEEESLSHGYFGKQTIRDRSEKSPLTFSLTQFDQFCIPTPMSGHRVNVNVTHHHQIQNISVWSDGAARDISLSPSEVFFQFVPLFPQYHVSYSPASVQSTIVGTFSDFEKLTSHGNIKTGKCNFYFYVLQ